MIICKIVLTVWLSILYGFFEVDTTPQYILEANPPNLWVFETYVEEWNWFGKPEHYFETVILISYESKGIYLAIQEISEKTEYRLQPKEYELVDHMSSEDITKMWSDYIIEKNKIDEEHNLPTNEILKLWHKLQNEQID